MQFQKFNEVTGEYISLPVRNLNIPASLTTPEIGNVKRTVHVGLTRSSGWHLSSKGLSFIPAFTEKRGIKTPFNIELVPSKGFVLKCKSSIFVESIPINKFLAVCFEEASMDLVLAYSMLDSIYFDKTRITVNEDGDGIDSLIRPSVQIDSTVAHNRFRTLFTKQTYIENNKRILNILSLKHFEGCELVLDTPVYDGCILEGTVLNLSDIFRLEHSGIPSVTIVTKDNAVHSIPLFQMIYTNLTKIGQSLSREEMDSVIDSESRLESVYVKGTSFGRISLPTTNDLQLYCIMLNRLITLNANEVNIDMNDYGNQTLTTIEDTINILNSQDTGVLEDRLYTSRDYLSGVSGIEFDRRRLEKSITGANSSLVTLTNDENPFARLASTSGSKVSKPVTHLPREAVQIRDSSQGFIDGVDSFENSNIGKTTTLCVTTSIKDRVLHTSLYVVENKTITDKVVEVSITDMPKYIVGEYNVDLTKEYCLAKVNNKTKYIKSDSITHARVSPFSSTSECRANSVFCENADIKRSQMTGKAAEQARTILMPERAMVETGIESVGLTSKDSLQFIFTVKDVIGDYIKLKDLDLSVDVDLHNDVFELNTLMRQSETTTFELVSTSDETRRFEFSLTSSKTLKGSQTFSDIVPPSNGDYYEIDDVLYKDHMVVKTNKEVSGDEPLSFHSKGDKSFFDYGIACGINIKVMLGFHHTATTDDACLISDRLIRGMGMHTPVMKEMKYTLVNGRDEAGFINGKQVANFTSEGLPQVGLTLYPNDPVMYKYTANSKTDEIEDSTVRLPFNVQGEVVKVTKTYQDGVIIYKVLLYDVAEIEVSDKLSGRHGNKATVAKILPQEQMPFDYETGESIDIVLNPLSITSRMNTGQIPEMYISTKQVNSGQGIKIEPLYQCNFKNYIKESKETSDTVMRQMVDGETGIPYPNKMYCGYMYFYRSVHLSSDKMKAIGNSKELDPAFLQAVGQGERKQRGQSIDAMQNDLLVAQDCNGILMETKGLLSGDVKAYSEMYNSLEDNPNAQIQSPGVNLQLGHIEMSTICLYIQAEQKGEKFRTRFASDEVLRKYRALELPDFNSDVVDSFISRDITCLDLGMEIVTPVAIKKFLCCNVIPVYTLNSSYKIELTYMTEKICNDLIEKQTMLVPVNDPDLQLFDDKPTYIINKYSTKKVDMISGMSAIISVLRLYTTDEIIDALNLIIKDRIDDKPLDPAITGKVFKAEQIAETGGFEQFISKLFPVMPLKYRMSSKDSSVQHDITRVYNSVANACRDILPYDDKAHIVYKAIFSALLSSKTQYKSVFEFIFDKQANGRMRGNILKTRVKNTLRANITPAGYVNPDYIGLPIQLALYIFQPIVNGIVKRKYRWFDNLKLDPIDSSDYLASIFKLPLFKVKEVTNGNITTYKQLDELWKVVASGCNDRYVSYTRAPCLHETSLQGGIVYVHNDYAIRLCTLLTAEQNADFDGDQEAVSAPFTEEAIKDIKFKLLPSAKTRRSNDGEISLRINQDSLFGLYLATVDSPSTDNIAVLSSIEEAYNGLKHGALSLTQTIGVMHKGNYFISTIGRMIVNWLVNDLTKSNENEPLVNKIITSNSNNDERVSISTLTSFINDNAHKVNRSAVDFISKLQEFGYRANHMSNTTLSIVDFQAIEEIPDPEELFLEDIKAIASLEDYGLLPKDWLFDMDSKFSNFKKSIKIMDTLGPSNAFYKMVDSGAKGKDSQLNKMFGIVGFPKGNVGMLPTPSLTGLVRGMSQFQSEDAAFEQRINAISTVHETAAPGVALRTGSFELGGLFVKHKSLRKVPKYKHRLFYNTKNYSKDFKVRVSGKFVDDVDMSRLTFNNSDITEDLIRQLMKHPDGIILMDDGITEIVFERVLDDLFKTMTDKHFNATSKRCISRAVSGVQANCDAKSFINYFDSNSGIAQDYVFVNSTGVSVIAEGTNIGVKASTSTSEPANQMVISRRNSVASTESYSGLTVFQNAVQYGKILDNDLNNIALLAPEDGVIHVQQERSGTLLTLESFSGNTYEYLVKVENESSREILVSNGDYVFCTQMISSIIGFEPEYSIHPTLSLTWSSSTFNQIMLKEILPNTTNYVVQFSRYMYFKFLYSLYKESGIEIDLLHYACYALQQLRTASIVYKEEEDRSLSRYLDIGNAMENSSKELIYNFELLNGKNTIINTSGSLAAFAYQDPLASVANSYTIGLVEESGYTGKLLLGTPLQSSISETSLVYGKYKTKEEKSSLSTIFKLVGHDDDTVDNLIEEEEEDDVFGDFFSELNEEENKQSDVQIEEDINSKQATQDKSEGDNTAEKKHYTETNKPKDDGLEKSSIFQ